MWRNAEWIHNLSQKLGVVDFDENFDNNFQMYRLLLRVALETRVAIEEKVVQTPKDYEFPDKIVNELDAMWNGTCYFAIKRQDILGNKTFQREMFFGNPPTTNIYAEIIQLPKLRNLIPIGKISDDTLLIHIHEPVPMLYAREGLSYATLVNDGGLVHNVSGGSFPKINQEDLESKTKQMSYLARDVYNSFMDAYDMFFFENQIKLSINFQKLIDYAEVGDEDYEYEDAESAGIFTKQ